MLLIKLNGKFYLTQNLNKYIINYMVNDKNNKEWLEAIKKDHNALLEIPKNQWTNELCLAAVKRDYSAISFMTEENLIKEICLAAYQQSPSAIRYVPKNLRELYEKYVENI